MNRCFTERTKWVVWATAPAIVAILLAANGFGGDACQRTPATIPAALARCEPISAEALAGHVDTAFAADWQTAGITPAPGQQTDGMVVVMGSDFARRWIGLS